MQLVERATVEHRGLFTVTRAKKNKEAGEVFKKLLKEKEFSQYKLEKVTGLDKSVISKIATGQTANPTPATLEKIAAALGIELGELTRIFAQSTVQYQQSATNPQPQDSVSEIPISNNSDFVGREEAIAHLNNLVNKGAKVILIQAEGGIGKATLAKEWFKRRGLEYLQLSVETTPEDLNSVEHWVKSKLRYYFKENPDYDFTTMLEQFKTKLQTKEIGILIEHLESSLIDCKFRELHRNNYVKLLKILSNTSAKSITFITSREPLHDDRLKLDDIKPYVLEGLEVDAWQDFFKIHNINI